MACPWANIARTIYSVLILIIFVFVSPRMT